MTKLSGALPVVAVKPVRFHISLNVSDLEKSIRFYSVLFDRQPDKRREDYAKFEPDVPPLVVSLEPNGRCGGGTLNHLGIRLPDERQLVSVQERLERAGIRSQREEGVECCYAKQTKFWVSDPDGTLWEFYTLDDDELDQRGTGQSLEVMLNSTLPPDATALEHMLGTPIPIRFDAQDNSIDEVRLRGSLNVPLSQQEKQVLLDEAIRVLKPKGRLLLRFLTGDQQHDNPQLGGKGLAIRFVPAKDDVVSWIANENLGGIRLLKYDDPPCFVYEGIKMRETHIEAFKQA